MAPLFSYISLNSVCLLLLLLLSYLKKSLAIFSNLVLIPLLAGANFRQITFKLLLFYIVCFVALPFRFSFFLRNFLSFILRNVILQIIFFTFLKLFNIRPNIISFISVFYCLEESIFDYLV